MVVTFSRESGVSIANAMRMTWDMEYDNGRRRYNHDFVRSALGWAGVEEMFDYFVFFLTTG